MATIVEVAADDDPRPVIFTVSAAFDRRPDMLWERRPQRDIDGVMAYVRQALEREATEIKITPYPSFDSASLRQEEREGGV